MSRYTDKPKDNMLKFRADKEISEKLDFLAKKENKSKSHIIRKGIEIQYQEIQYQNEMEGTRNEKNTTGNN